VTSEEIIPRRGDSTVVEQISKEDILCAKCNLTHWITVSIAAQKKLDDLINVNLNQQIEIGQLRRHITELNTIIETRNLWRDGERRH
jgi:hypothetical protein